MAQALEAAQTYRDEIFAEPPGMTRRAQYAILKKNNRTGVSGVTRSVVMDRRLEALAPPSCTGLRDGLGRMGQPRSGGSRPNDSANGAHF